MNAMLLWKKRAANSQWVSITYDRPISFDKFLAYSDEDKKKYLQIVIDNHGGTTDRIATMFSCTEANVKKFRQDLDIKNPVYKYGNADIDSLWDTFLTLSDFLYNPMSYEDFKKMDVYDQQEHINFLQSEFNFSLRNLASLYFNISNSALIRHINKFKISYISKKPGAAGHLTDEEQEKFNNWLGLTPEEIKGEEPEMKEDIATPDTNEPIEQPTIAESVTEIPSMQVSLRIDSMDQIIEMVKKLTRAKQGRLYFVWGGE